MQLDRNRRGNHSRGKYALVKMRQLHRALEERPVAEAAEIEDALCLLCKSGILNDDDEDERALGIRSGFEVTPDDVERLREGRSLIVRIHGWQPPIALYIDPQKPDLLPQDIAQKAWSDAEETAFQAGVEAMRELAGYVAIHACLTPPDGGSPTEDEREMCAEVARQIYASGMPLKPTDEKK